MVIDVDESGAERVSAELRAMGIRSTAYTVDVRNAPEVVNVIAKTVKQYGRLDFMVNNVGYFVAGPLEEKTPSEIDSFVDINVRGVLNGVVAAYPVMLKQGSGMIVNIASISGLVPAPGSTLYGMAKHAVVGLSLSLLAEASANGIHVCVACPGFIDTKLTSGMTAMQRRFLYSPERLASNILTAVERRRAVVVVPWWSKMSWQLYRFSPRLGNALAARISRKVHTR
jgi:short-subunit dehydrogenase